MTETQLESYLALNDDELLMEIARLADPRAPLSSPPRLISKGAAVVEQQLNRVRGVVCPRKELIDSPEFALGTVIFGILVDHLTLGLASAVAAYIAKRGVLWLCDERAAAASTTSAR